MLLENGWLVDARHVPSPHHDCRPEDEKPTLLVVHNISLPPGEFGGPWIDALFTGTIDPDAHPFFAEIAHLRVSAHCLIRRDGEVVQYVPFDKRAWHAGVSMYHGRERCNDFSIGIELEGTDTTPYTDSQYQQLAAVTRTLLMMAGVMVITFLLLRSLYGLFFNVPLLVVWILLGVLCIGAGKVRLHYHAYLKAASRDDAHARNAMASELTMIHGVPPDCDEREFLRELQNALLWINFRYYLAPLFWFVVGGPWGPVLLMGYAFLRAWQTWLARYLTPHERLLSGIDAILHVVDWLPVRLVGVVYALIGHGEKALPAWFASLADRHTSQYQVLTRLAQFSLAREPHTDKIETPKAAVSMAKKTSFVVVVIVALLTIYGTLV